MLPVISTHHLSDIVYTMGKRRLPKFGSRGRGCSSLVDPQERRGASGFVSNGTVEESMPHQFNEELRSAQTLRLYR